MDRSLTLELAHLAEIALALLSPSRRFEAPRRSPQTALRALELLGSLDLITRESLLPQIAASQAAAALAAAKAVAAKAPPAPAPKAPPAPVRVATSRSEYRAALGDSTLVQALLELSQKKQALAQSRARSGGAPGFRPSPSPQIEAQPKREGFHRAPGVYNAILRPNRK